MTGRLCSLLGAAVLCAVFAAGCAHGSAAKTAAVSGSPAPAALGDRSRGAEIFRANCAVCHTASGAAGGVGPSLQNEKQRKNYGQTIAVIEEPDPPMPKLYPSPLSERDVEDVATYVQSL